MHFKLLIKYELICESKKASKKFILGGPNVVLTKKTKPGFWVGINEKFLVRLVQQEQFDIDDFMANAVIYEIYQIWEPDSKWLMPIKDGTLNCVV